MIIACENRLLTIQSGGEFHHSLYIRGARAHMHEHTLRTEQRNLDTEAHESRQHVDEICADQARTKCHPVSPCYPHRIKLAVNAF